MFGRRYSAEKVAEHLRSWLLPADTANFIGGYYAAVRPDETEQTRVLFSLHLFPIAVIYCIAEAKNDPALIEATREAHDMYLSTFRDNDQIVRIGQYIIWRVERESLAHLLRERLSQLILPSGLDDHQIRYGMLLRIVSEIRKQTFMHDLTYGMAQAPNDGRRGLTIALESAGRSFTRQVLMIDPGDPTLTHAQLERYKMSVGIAAAFLFGGYHTLAHNLKTM